MCHKVLPEGCGLHPSTAFAWFRCKEAIKRQAKGQQFGCPYCLKHTRVGAMGFRSLLEHGHDDHGHACGLTPAPSCSSTNPEGHHFSTSHNAHGVNYNPTYTIQPTSCQSLLLPTTPGHLSARLSHCTHGQPSSAENISVSSASIAAQ